MKCLRNRIYLRWFTANNLFSRAVFAADEALAKWAALFCFFYWHCFSTRMLSGPMLNSRSMMLRLGRKPNLDSNT